MTPGTGDPTAKVNLAGKLDLIREYWRPKIVGELGDVQVKLVKLKGEFVWHRHPSEDELFLILRGHLTIRLRDRDIALDEGEMCIVPHGAEHLPVADDEVHVLLIEPKSTVNTGDAGGARTARAEWV